MSTKRTRRGRRTTDDDSGESDTHTSIHPSDQGKGTGRHEDAEETQLESKLHGCKLANKLEARARDGREGKRSGDVPMQTTRLVKCVCVCVCVCEEERIDDGGPFKTGWNEGGRHPSGRPVWGDGPFVVSQGLPTSRRSSLVAHRSRPRPRAARPRPTGALPDVDTRTHRQT